MGIGNYVGTEADTLPVLIADEAYRLNEKPTFFGRDKNQIMDIINGRGHTSRLLYEWNMTISTIGQDFYVYKGPTYSDPNR